MEWVIDEGTPPKAKYEIILLTERENVYVCVYA